MRKFFLKILLLFLPIALLVGVAIETVPSPAALQNAALEHKIEQLLLGPKDSPNVIIGGDSLPATSIIPSQLMERTGRTVANIAVDGEYAHTIYAALERQGITDHGHLLIFDVDINELNDGSIGFLDRDVVWKEPLSVEKLRALWAYYSYYFYYYDNHLKDALRPHVAQDMYGTDATTTNSGYLPRTGTLELPLPADVNDVSWYQHTKLDGIKWEAFKAMLARMGASSDTIVLYFSPIDPAWRASFPPSFLVAQRAMTQRVTAEAAQYKNIYVLDFFDGIPGLTDAQYSDTIHLNTTGAPVFTGALADTLQKKGLLR